MGRDAGPGSRRATVRYGYRENEEAAFTITVLDRRR